MAARSIDTRRLVSRYLAGEISTAELRRAFPCSVWSPDYGDLPHVGAIQLMIAEDDYPAEYGGQNSDEINRDRLRYLLAEDAQSESNTPG